MHHGISLLVKTYTKNSIFWPFWAHISIPITAYGSGPKVQPILEKFAKVAKWIRQLGGTFIDEIPDSGGLWAYSHAPAPIKLKFGQGERKSVRLQCRLYCRHCIDLEVMLWILVATEAVKQREKHKKVIKTVIGFIQMRQQCRSPMFAALRRTLHNIHINTLTTDIAHFVWINVKKLVFVSAGAKIHHFLLTNFTREAPAKTLVVILPICLIRFV